ncbi:hypothetical protein JCM3770_000817 [Rhodotorula araucariae]
MAAPLVCDPCRPLFKDNTAFLQHMALVQCRSPSTTKPSAPPTCNSQFCITCDEWCPTHIWMSHVRSHRHAEAAAYQQYQERLASSTGTTLVPPVEVLASRIIDFGHTEYEPKSGNDTPSTVSKSISLKAGPAGFSVVSAVFVSSTRPSLNKPRFPVSKGASKYWFEGRVVDVCEKRIGIAFDKQFQPAPTDEFQVQFSVSDSVARRQLCALQDEPARPDLVFPSKETVYSGPPTDEDARSHKFLDSKIARNPHQRDAILSIFHGSSGPAPFVLFGPPGTGKMTTLVEAVRQLIAYREDTKLLLAAPSNAAADVLCGSLNLPPDQRYCFTDTDNHNRYVCPELDALRKYRVVVVTCMSASMISGVGVERGHFTHIFVDKAGQATEPQTYVPMSLADENTSVILAGDPKQLGPVVHSSVAIKFGLDKSLLERLMELDDYKETNMARRGSTYVKLKHNYRSHPSILTIPNELFYGGELQAMANVQTQNKLLGWSGWATQDFPIIFHSVKGEDEREGNNPSFFNVAELTVVDSYVMHLLDPLNGAAVAEKDIGVITPYSAQVKRLQRMLNRDKMTVGSVEQFQGQERSVIIISTTRSNRQWLEHDTVFALGFLSSPKRFNVAVTRAASGLIVVGNADTLAVDPLWRKFLLFVHDHGGWVGEAWDADAARKAEFDPVKAALGELEEVQRRMGGLELD